jgi:hypothetical protein
MFRRALAVLFVATALAGCQAKSNSSPEREWVMKTYDVPDRFRGQLTRALEEAFGASNGRFAAAPNGQLLVYADPRVHGYIEVAVKRANEGVKEEPTTRSLHLEYWLVLGKTADPAPALGKDLAHLAAPLKAVAQADGPQAFELLEKLAITTLSDEQGEARGQHTRVEQLATWTGDRIHARVTFERGDRKTLSTRIVLAPEQTVVLGQVGYLHEPAPEKGPSRDLRKLYYIVRASPVDPQPTR